MKNVRMSIPHISFIFFNLKIFGEIVTPMRATKILLRSEGFELQIKRFCSKNVSIKWGTE